MELVVALGIALGVIGIILVVSSIVALLWYKRRQVLSNEIESPESLLAKWKNNLIHAIRAALSSENINVEQTEIEKAAIFEDSPKGNIDDRPSVTVQGTDVDKSQPVSITFKGFPDHDVLSAKASQGLIGLHWKYIEVTKNDNNVVVQWKTLSPNYTKRNI